MKTKKIFFFLHFSSKVPGTPTKNVKKKKKKKRKKKKKTLTFFVRSTYEKCKNCEKVIFYILRSFYIFAVSEHAFLSMRFLA